MKYEERGSSSKLSDGCKYILCNQYRDRIGNIYNWPSYHCNFIAVNIQKCLLAKVGWACLSLHGWYSCRWLAGQPVFVSPVIHIMLTPAGRRDDCDAMIREKRRKTPSRLSGDEIVMCKNKPTSRDARVRFNIDDLVVLRQTDRRTDGRTATAAALMRTIAFPLLGIQSILPSVIANSQCNPSVDLRRVGRCELAITYYRTETTRLPYLFAFYLPCFYVIISPCDDWFQFVCKITHAGVSQSVGRVISGVCDFVCVWLCVCLSVSANLKQKGLSYQQQIWQT